MQKNNGMIHPGGDRLEKRSLANRRQGKSQGCQNVLHFIALSGPGFRRGFRSSLAIGVSHVLAFRPRRPHLDHAGVQGPGDRPAHLRLGDLGYRNRDDGDLAQSSETAPLKCVVASRSSEKEDHHICETFY